MLSYIFVKRHSIFNHFTRAWICVCVCVCVSVVSHHTIWEPNQGGKGRRFLEELYLLTGSVNLCVCVGPIVLGTYGEGITVGGGFVFFFFFLPVSLAVGWCRWVPQQSHRRKVRVAQNMWWRDYVVSTILETSQTTPPAPPAFRLFPKLVFQSAGFNSPA